jgi:hypothetical protein
MKNSVIKSLFVLALMVSVSSAAFTTVDGYGGGGTRVKKQVEAAPLVLGAATSTVATSTVAFNCEGMYINSYMRMGQENNAGDVLKLQIFLNAMGITAPTSSVFDIATDAAVRSFQTKYMADVLAPWGLTNGTGYVFKTTRAKINNMVCPGSEVTPTI